MSKKKGMSSGVQEDYEKRPYQYSERVRERKALPSKATYYI